MFDKLKSWAVWLYCFEKGKATVTGTIIASAPVVLRNLAEQLQLKQFPDEAAMITSLLGLGLVVVGLLRKLVGWFVKVDENGTVRIGGQKYGRCAE